jgi:hypothetical protein
MAKEKFDRSKPHVNVGTIGARGPRKNNFDSCHYYGFGKENCRC